MLLIEKLVKLLDDSHYEIFYEHVRTLSKRSYYPLVLLDVIDRDLSKELPSEKMFFQVYGENVSDPKDLQKLFQLGHYTFRLTSFLSRNYPNYLGWNITRLHHLINTGKLKVAKQLADTLLEVATKIEDFGTERAVLGILAQNEVHQQSFVEGRRYYERIGLVLANEQQLNELNLICYEQGYDNSAKISPEELDERLLKIQGFFNSSATGIRLLARLEFYHLLHVGRDDRFFEDSTEIGLNELSEDLQKNEYIVLPYLQNLRSKLDFLRLRYSMRKNSDDTVVQEAEQLMQDAAGELFWNSYVNLPELSSIAVQTSFLVSNYFYSYREDADDLVPPETRQRIERLKERCEVILNNPVFEERYVIPYINLNTIYAGLLLLGDEKDRKSSISTLEIMLMNYQQVAFHAYLDPVFVTLIMAAFSLNDTAGLERSYRRYKKSSKDKNVNFENDLILHAYYFITKYRETNRAGYAKKLKRLLEQAAERPTLAFVHAQLQGVCTYFSIPI